VSYIFGDDGEPRNKLARSPVSWRSALLRSDLRGLRRWIRATARRSIRGQFGVWLSLYATKERIYASINILMLRSAAPKLMRQTIPQTTTAGHVR